MLNKSQPVDLSKTEFESRLNQVGHVLHRNDAEMIYVLMLVFDTAGKTVVGLLKQKGPAQVLDKVTFPGGRVEQGERLEHAASREMDEETGLVVPPKEWVFVSANAVVAVFTAMLPSIDHARTMESEPVFLLDVNAQLDMLALRPGIYAHDFEALLRAARAKLRLDSRCCHD